MFENAWKAAVAVAAVLLAVAGCGRDGDRDALESGDGILGFVPADTAYVFATPERMPDDVLDKLEANADSVYGAYETVIRASMSDLADELETQGDNEQARLVTVTPGIEIDLDGLSKGAVLDHLAGIGPLLG